jgi:hypothetical protein
LPVGAAAHGRRTLTSYKLIVFTDPVPGREDEYNDWYDHVHLRDVLAVPGFVAAQRFRLTMPMIGDLKSRYLAVYEFEAAIPAEVLAEIGRRAGTDQMVVIDAVDMGSASAAVFEPCSEGVFAPDAVRPGDAAS